MNLKCLESSVGFSEKSRRDAGVTEGALYPLTAFTSVDGL
jgi:hypothetical protein